MELSWSATAMMLITHGNECGRPRYMRTVLFYGSPWERLFTTKVGNVVAQFFPALFGAKAIVCLTCKSYAYDGKVAGAILNISRSIRMWLNGGEDIDEIILYDPEDIKSLTPRELEILGFAEEDL